jgi:hypothetical protein
MRSIILASLIFFSNIAFGGVELNLALKSKKLEKFGTIYISQLLTIEKDLIGSLNIEIYPDISCGGEICPPLGPEEIILKPGPDNWEELPLKTLVKVNSRVTLEFSNVPGEISYAIVSLNGQVYKLALTPTARPANFWRD